ncbi:MAG: hypothetical protein RIB70_07740 [Roseitalea porphyridii]|uniref:hypothetical protein n=1 Tax=Roseitalea porphyridii TaxID=1852022 RepID=UPI0032EAA066
MTAFRTYPILGAAAAQFLGLAALVLMRAVFADQLWAEGAFLSGLAAQCGVAALATWLIGLPVWWVFIAVAFPLALAAGLRFETLPAWPFGIAFVLIYLFFSNTARDRVPLYLSNRRTAQALSDLMRQRGARCFIDLGSGMGGVVRALDGDGRVARGVETAPMVWLLSALMSRMTGRGQILRQDIWTTDLSGEDLVYAFLSTEPMPALYNKARSEMKPGGLLVSNSFPVPSIDADEVWELSDRRRTKLYVYEIRKVSPASENSLKRNKKQ